MKMKNVFIPELPQGTPDVTRPKGYLKGYAYEWAFDGYKSAMKMHWTPEEVSLAQDITDFKLKIKNGERNLLTSLFRFFTQGDVDVGQAYMDRFIPVFRNEEVRMMLSTFASFESLHADAYSILVDQLGLPESEYKAFRNWAEMAAKHDYLESMDLSSEEDVAKNLAVFSAFTEGLQLFSTFAILMNFARGDRKGGAVMRGMNQIVTWSIKDESLHVEKMSQLFRTFIEERPHLWTEELKAEIVEICRHMVKLEDDFIDLCWREAGGEVEGLTAEEVKSYIRYIADRRLNGIGLDSIFGIESNPLKWLAYMLNGVEHANFFETRATEYAKGSLSGSWADVWAVPELVPLDEADFQAPLSALENLEYDLAHA